MTSIIFPYSPGLYVLLGLFIGTLGTLVGAGGGFILVPILVFLLPSESPDRITAISMAVVFFNALSGTIAYARMQRVDFSSGWIFAIAALPGALLGAVSTAYIPRHLFDVTLGTALVTISIFLFWKGIRKSKSIHDSVSTEKDEHFELDARGKKNGSILSAFVGFLSSALGIGGGIIHVPALVYVLGYPVHIATATSHFVLACTSLVALLEHLIHGSYSGNLAKTALLAVGAIAGAQVGARLSTRMKGPAIVLGLALALAFAGFRIILRTLS